MRGTTLSETLVAAGLSLLTLTVLTLCLVLSGKFWRRADEAQTAQQEALAIQVRLQADYRASKFGSLQGGSDRLGFLSYQAAQAQDLMWTPQGVVVWRKWVFYRYHSGRIERREFPLETPSEQPELTAPSWPPELPGTRLASHVSSFQIVQARSDRPLLNVRYTVQVGTARQDAQCLILPRLYAPDPS